MIEKLAGIKNRFAELNNELSKPETVSDQERYKRLMKERADMEPIIAEYDNYASLASQVNDNKELLENESDDDFRQMLHEDIASLNEQLKESEEKLKVLLLPKDPNDEKNVILEIRAGVGGDEAALFAGDLLRMYLRYAERRRYKTEIMSSTDIGIGGFKEVIVSVSGKGAYSRLKYESGTHRVQRVPETESSGRIHTSAATVAVLPEAEDVEVEINPNDLRIDVYRSTGNGGQSVNTTDSAVRITHLPSGLVVSCQDEKSQLKNKDKAMKILRSRLLEIEMRKQHESIASSRRSQIGSGDRSERIRTYNFPQGRVTDHRINLTTHRLSEILDGDLDELIDTLITSDRAQMLEAAE